MEQETLYLSSSLNKIVAKGSDIESSSVLDLVSCFSKVISEESSTESLLDFNSSRTFNLDFKSELFEIEE